VTRKPCKCSQSDDDTHFAYYRRGREKRGPFSPKAAGRVEDRDGPPDRYECEGCGGQLWLDQEAVEFRAEPSEDHALEEDPGTSLAIPYAIAHERDDSDEGEEITPEEAEGVDGLLFCPVCRDEVRVRGIHTQKRRAHFAHLPDSGEDCPWRTEGSGSAYESEEKEDWRTREFGASRKRTLHLELRLQHRDAVLIGKGLPLEEQPLRNLIEEEDTVIDSPGIRGHVDLSHVHWRQAEFSIAVADPIEARVKISSTAAGIQARWEPSLTSAEIRHKVIPFVSSNGVTAHRVSDFEGEHRELLLVYKSASSSSSKKPSSSARDFLSQQEIPWEETEAARVRGSSDWAVLRLPWDSTARDLVKTLERQAGGTRRPIDVTPLSVEARQTHRATVVPIDENRVGRFWARSRYLPEVEVELVPVPYDEDAVDDLRLDRQGNTIELHLDPSEQSGILYLLAIDPEDDSKFLEDYRLTVVEQDSWEERYETKEHDFSDSRSHPLGLWVHADDGSELLSPLENRQQIVSFDGDPQMDSIPRLEALEIAAPEGFTEQTSLMRQLSLLSYEEKDGERRRNSASRLEDLDQFHQACRILSRRGGLSEIEVHFGSLGSISLIPLDHALERERRSIRLLLLAGLIDSYDDDGITMERVEELVSSLVPDHQKDYEWTGEVGELLTHLRKQGGPTLDGLRNVVDAIFAEKPWNSKDLKLFRERGKRANIASTGVIAQLAGELLDEDREVVP
jgi:hypothetical protein